MGLHMRAIAGGALLCLSALVLLLDEGAAAHTPLQVEGQGGFWNQVVIGQDKAYHERIGGVTIAGKRPIASFVDRETPQMFNKRWDLGSSGGRLIVTRSNRRQMVSVDRGGSAIFRGRMKVDGVLRVQNLALHGAKQKASDGHTLKLGTPQTSSMRFGQTRKHSWIQSDKSEHLVINPRLKGKKAALGVSVFSQAAPKHVLDVKGDMWVGTSVKLGASGKTRLTTDKLAFAMGGGWTSSDPKWISSLKSKPVHFNGAVFGTRLGVGTEVKRKEFRLQVHNGHFVVTAKVGKFLKGLTTYMMPRGAHVKAYDYTRKKLQKWRITGTKILLNPSQKGDGRVCVGCDKPEHHLQSEGNMYVNGNVFVNMHLHVKGHMHIDKIITPHVVIHLRAETPQYGRGIMIGNDLPNKWKTKTNMRIGYNKDYAWVQSHKEVPLVVNPIGGSTCITCKRPKKKIELQVGGHGYVNGELYVATLKKKKKKGKKGAKTGGKEEQEAMSALSLAEAKTVLEKELGAEELNVVSAWGSAAKIVQENHKSILKRKSQIADNEVAIRSLERQIMMLK